MTRSAPGWRTSLIVDGFFRNGRRVPVLTGLLETAAGDMQLALRVGAEGDPVILPLEAGGQLMVNLREVLLERVRLAGEGL